MMALMSLVALGRLGPWPWCLPPWPSRSMCVVAKDWSRRA